jgi:hypothetical protein
MVRFICLEIFATGVRAFECLRSSACIAFVQATFVLLTFFAINRSSLDLISVTRYVVTDNVTNNFALLACLKDWR